MKRRRSILIVAPLVAIAVSLVVSCGVSQKRVDAYIARMTELKSTEVYGVVDSVGGDKWVAVKVNGTWFAAPSNSAGYAYHYVQVGDSIAKKPGETLVRVFNDGYPTLKHMASDSLKLRNTMSNKDSSDIYIISQKKNETTIILRTYDRKEVLRTTLTMSQENKISTADLDNANYTVEAYDKTGLVMRGRFLKRKHDTKK